MWESVPEGKPGPGWAELDENGWGALIGWVAAETAGAGILRRVPEDDSVRTVTTSRVGPDGSAVEIEEPFTAEDRVIVDEAANSYLLDAGVEKRPGGYRWFIRLPKQFSNWEEFRPAVTGAVYARDEDLTHPSQIRWAMEQVIRPMYEAQG